MIARMVCYETHTNFTSDDSEAVQGNYISMKGTVIQENIKSRTSLIKSMTLILKLKLPSKTVCWDRWLLQAGSGKPSED